MGTLGLRQCRHGGPEHGVRERIEHSFAGSIVKPYVDRLVHSQSQE